MKQLPMLDLKLEYDYMKKDIDSAIQRCLEYQRWIFGPEVKEFEDAIRKYIGVKHCIGVSSGTEALVLSLRAIAIKLKGEEYFDREDEIITTPFTFTATGDAILRAGATPVFVDIDPFTCNIDAKKILSALSSMPSANKIVGILPVHLYGQPSNMDEIMGIAKEFDLFVLEDVAQAFGAMWKDKKLGSIGDVGAFSFFPSKNLGAFGDAGMIATNNDGIAELARMLLKHGGKDKYNVDHIGYNARLDTLQAAVLLAKFKYINEFNERRGKIAEIYNRELSGVKGLSLPIAFTNPLLTSHSSLTVDSHHVFHQYTVCTPKRDELQAYLKKKGISTMVYYPFPLHKMKVFEGKNKIYENMANAERAAKEVLSLPIEPLQEENDTMYVAGCIKNFFNLQ
jgi:UDP-2-acetamido-2-deoxy-ribo-hexuluronate aminotransferase